MKPGPAAIVSTWSPPTLGAPQALGNLLKYLPPESYFLVTSYEHLRRSRMDEKQWLPCDYFFFDRKELISRGPRHESLPLTEPPRELNHAPVSNRFWGAAGLFVSIFKKAGAILRAVKSKNASVIVGISDGGPALIGAYLASLVTGKPLILYFFDLYLGNCLDGPQHVLARIFEPFIFKRARRVIVTNEATEEYYKNKYGDGAPVDVIPNSVDPAQSTSSAYRDSDSPKTIVFTGNVYWSVEQSLGNLVEAMALLGDLPIKLEIYSPQLPRDLGEKIQSAKNIEQSFCEPSKISVVQGKAWRLFLPMSWDTPFPDIIWTASPAKLTDYVVAKRPILVHAPEDAYVAKFVVKHGLGLAITKNDPTALADAIRESLNKDESFSSAATPNLITQLTAKHNAFKLEKILKRVSRDSP